MGKTSQKTPFPESKQNKRAEPEVNIKDRVIESSDHRIIEGFAICLPMIQ